MVGHDPETVCVTLKELGSIPQLSDADPPAAINAEKSA